MYFIIALVNAVLTYKIRQIEKASRQKEERANAIKLYNTFINSLSHELRTPIATIIGATDNLQAGNENLTANNRDQLIAEISKASLRLNQQVENLLSISRLESGFLKPRKDWCDISELVYDVIRGLEEGNPRCAIHYNSQADIPLFNLDKGLLEQIIYNLVNNACLHTPPDTDITITAEGRQGLLRLRIEDNGPGFPEDEIGLVFDKFYRLRGSTTNGTGLGLSIVKGFTEALGGTIQLQNLPTGGCRFTVEIPAETSYLKV
jgi:two-component system sensor histidine kinase KdpD